ncbi:MAG: lysylphosphatidylglycerol synthase transmembrane domain-containing protein [Acidobacteria bacterium]|nr:lysylphosphatidylglycerol synthase transmembrane domain-containing protein [Acidobacteriota bacterium]
MRRPGARQAIQGALTAVGLALLLYLIWRIGLAAVWENLTHFGWWLLLTCALGTLWLFLQACAWWKIQDTFFERVALSELFKVKIISDAFNLLLPSASMGGDAMRAFMIRTQVPLRVGVPAVLFDKTVEIAASVVFLITGLALGLVFLRLPQTLVIPAVVSIAATIVGIVLLVVVQRRGVTSSLLKLGVFSPSAIAWITSKQSQFLAMDDNFRLLYSGGVSRAALPLLFHLSGRVIGALEFMIVLAVLGAPITLVQALFISTIVTVGNTVFFLLPGQWGVMESVHILVVQSLGYPPAVGLSLSIIRRIRRLALVGVALVLFAMRRDKGASAPQPSL